MREQLQNFDLFQRPGLEELDLKQSLVNVRKVNHTREYVDVPAVGGSGTTPDGSNSRGRRRTLASFVSMASKNSFCSMRR